MTSGDKRIRLGDLLSGDSSAAIMVRKLLPAALGAPLVAGALRFIGQSQGLYSTIVGVSLFTAAMMICAVALLLWTARSLERVDRKRRNAEELVRRSRAQHRALARNFPDGAVVLFDRDLRHLIADGSGLADVGLSSEAMEGRTIWEVFPPEVCAAIEPRYRCALAGESSTFEYAYGLRTYTVRVVPVRDEVSGEIRSGAATVQDISARKREEAELREATERLQEAEARYRTLVEQLPLVTYIRPLDLSAPNIYVSPQVEQLFGIPRERWESDPELLQKHVHPDDLDRVLAAASEVRSSGVPFRGEYRFVRPDGEIVWVQDETYLVRDADGRPLRVEGYVLDLTERKRAEAERDRLHGDLLHAQKLDAIGQLAGGVAHEFNNMLMAINGHSGLLLGRLPADSPLRRDVEQIVGSADRAATITRQLLAFGRKQLLEVGPVEVNEVVDSSLALLRPLLGPRIELVTRLEPGIPPAVAERTQLEQVLVNLVLNARDAIADDGTITITTGAREIGEPAASQEGVEAGHFVNLAVTDTGPGIDEETRARVFEPFFTTKELGKGTGLGLSTAYGIVRQGGGFLAVGNRPGGGAYLSVFLPASSEPVSPLAEVPPAAETSPGGSRALVVDDEPAVRSVCAELLSELGHQVETAADAGEALELLERGPAFDVLVTDLVMPGMNGAELGRRVRARHPETAVVYMSAHPGSGETGVETDPHFLQKPFGAGELGAALDALSPAAGEGGAVTCVVADDHPYVLDAVARVLDESGIRVVGRAVDGRQALSQIADERPDVALLDVAMPDGGIEAARRAHEASPGTRVLLYTGRGERALVRDALAAGAHGLVLKGAPLAEVAKAIAMVAEGGIYVDQSLAGALVPGVAQAEDEGPRLTAREQEVLLLLADGNTNDEAGRVLEISAETVQTHVRNAMKKLGAETRTQAVAKAMRRALIG